MVKNVLVVDDDDDLLFLYSVAFKLFDNVQIAGSMTNGQEAVNYFTSIIGKGNNVPDIMLIDYRMPVMDGLTAIKQIRDLMGNKLFIMLATADANAIKTAKQGNVKVDGFLKKPFRLSEIREKIDSITKDASSEAKVTITRS